MEYWVWNWTVQQACGSAARSLQFFFSSSITFIHSFQFFRFQRICYGSAEMESVGFSARWCSRRISSAGSCDCAMGSAVQKLTGVLRITSLSIIGIAFALLLPGRCFQHFPSWHIFSLAGISCWVGWSINSVFRCSLLLVVILLFRFYQYPLWKQV